MTAAELSTRFDIELDAIASGVAPGFLNSEKSQFLTKAEDELIKSFVQLGDYKSIHTLVERIQTTSLSLDNTYTSKVYYIDLYTVIPNFRYHISTRALITRTDPTLTSQWVNCESISREDMYKFFENGFNTPYFKHPKIVLELSEGTTQSRLYLILDAYTSIPTPAGIEVAYVRKPAGIDIDTSATSELPEFLHKDVVSLAVQEAVKSLYISKLPQKE